MKNLKKNMIFFLIIFSILLTTNSYAFSINNSLDKIALGVTNISGICKTYKEGEAIYYKKNSDGVYGDRVSNEEKNNIRTNIKRTIDSLASGKYLMSKIIKNDAYFNSANKEFCFKKDYFDKNVDTLTKVILIGYDDNYQFKSNLASSRGAYIVKKVGETSSFYVSYEDSWIESELSEMSDATGIRLDKTNIVLKVGETEQISYTVLPDNALSKSVKIDYSSNITIDTTTSGVVKIQAVKGGDAYIIVKLKLNEEISTKCNIKVISDNIPETGDVTSSKYLVDKQSEFISKISPNTTLSKFKAQITSNEDYKIYDKYNKIVTLNSTLIATGMKLKTQKRTYTLIVKGDTNCNGKISIADVVSANLYITNLKNYNEIEKKAADVDGNGRVSIADVIAMKLAIVGVREI